MLLPFVQFEYAGSIGLPDGRFLARDGERERVLIVRTLGVPRRPGRRQRRPRPVDPSDPEAVPLTRVTIAGGDALGDDAAAAEWLKRATADAESRAREVRSATRLLNRALGALRAGARDPLIQDVGATRALAVRIGYGSGDALADGRWSEAIVLPPPKRGRLDGVDPQSRVAAVLAGRDEVHPAETLLLRARLDAEMGREREARYGLAAATSALEAEPPASGAEELRAQIAALERRIGE